MDNCAIGLYPCVWIQYDDKGRTNIPDSDVWLADLKALQTAIKLIQHLIMLSMKHRMGVMQLEFTYM